MRIGIKNQLKTQSGVFCKGGCKKVGSLFMVFFKDYLATGSVQYFTLVTLVQNPVCAHEFADNRELGGITNIKENLPI